jgi:hypothetical protein
LQLALKLTSSDSTDRTTFQLACHNTKSPLYLNCQLTTTTKMFQRSMFRAVPRLMRSPAMQRRFASTENQFIKEREAVKEHAAATTGAFDKSLSIPVSKGQLRNYRFWINQFADFSTFCRALAQDLHLVSLS